MTSKNPLVSIIIPSYNRATYIIETIKSAINQDYDNTEIIITDNSDNDDVENALKPYIEKYNNIKYFRNEQNIGMIPNWKKAIYERAKGEWCIILSDDDYFINNGYIKKAIELAKTDKDIKLIHSNFGFLFNETGHIDYGKKKLPTIIDGNEYFMQHLNMNSTNSIGLLVAIFHRKTAIERACFNTLIPSGDLQAWLLIMTGNKVGFIEDYTALYRVHQNNYTVGKTPESVISYLECYTTPKNYALKNNIFPETQLKKWEDKMTLTHFSNTMITNLIEKRFQENKNLIKYLKKEKRLKTSYYLNPKFLSVNLFSILPPFFYNNFEDLYFKIVLKRENPRSIQKKDV